MRLPRGLSRELFSRVLCSLTSLLSLLLNTRLSKVRTPMAHNSIFQPRHRRGRSHVYLPIVYLPYESTSSHFLFFPFIFLKTDSTCIPTLHPYNIPYHLSRDIEVGVRARARAQKPRINFRRISSCAYGRVSLVAESGAARTADKSTLIPAETGG